MVDDAGQADPLVTPVKELPAESMINRLAGTKLRLADGTELWAILGNISPENPVATKHFLTVAIYRKGKWFDLARYHDVDFARRGAAALAGFLNKRISEIFPISFDLTPLVLGKREALAGQIDHDPSARLSTDDLIRLSLE